jgi:plasmid maintenance system antidote protein VapI
MKERVIQVMNTKGLSSSKFAEEIGIQRAAMSHILNERNKVSADVLTKILTRFQDISPEWLLLGIGQMQRNISNHPQMKQTDMFTNVTSGKPGTPKESMPRKEPVPEPVSKETVPGDLSPTATVIKDTFVSMETPSKKISQIMIFFSDHTYEVFHPEKG